MTHPDPEINAIQQQLLADCKNPEYRRYTELIIIVKNATYRFQSQSINGMTLEQFLKENIAESDLIEYRALMKIIAP